MKALGRRAVLLALLAACASCADAPLPTTPVPQASVLRTPDTRPGRTFVAVPSPDFRMSGYTLASEMVLYDDGTFALRFATIGFEYGGTYKEAGGTVVFTWNGWSTAGPWGATGTLVKDTLTVRYNTVMQLSDFEDAMYVLKQGQ